MSEIKVIGLGDGWYVSVRQGMENKEQAEQTKQELDSALKFFDECWVWDKSLNKDGYGITTINYKSIYTHRLSWELHNGKIPNDKVIDHKCKNRACYNPNHLQLVTHAKNIQLGTCANREKTHCLRGHEFTEENTYVHKNGERRCRTCQRGYKK